MLTMPWTFRTWRNVRSTSQDNIRCKETHTDTQTADPEFYDVKFYPYNPPGSNPVFAIVAKNHVSTLHALAISCSRS